MKIAENELRKKKSALTSYFVLLLALARTCFLIRVDPFSKIRIKTFFNENEKDNTSATNYNVLAYKLIYLAKYI